MGKFCNRKVVTQNDKNRIDENYSMFMFALIDVERKNKEKWLNPCRSLKVTGLILTPLPWGGA